MTTNRCLEISTGKIYSINSLRVAHKRDSQARAQAPADMQMYVGVFTYACTRQARTCDHVPFLTHARISLRCFTGRRASTSNSHYGCCSCWSACCGCCSRMNLEKQQAHCGNCGRRPTVGSGLVHMRVLKRSCMAWFSEAILMGSLRLMFNGANAVRVADPPMGPTKSFAHAVNFQ